MNLISLSNSFYQLASQTGEGAERSKLGQNIQQQTLADVLGNNAGDEAYTLDIGADAQKYLNFNQFGEETENNFILTTEQQATLDKIIEKYKFLPVTEENFKKLQQDLEQAGLSPEILALQDKVRNFNPAEILIAALNGTDPNQSNGVVTDEESSQKKENYIKSILKSWQG